MTRLWLPTVAMIAAFAAGDAATQTARADIIRIDAGLIASQIENAFRGTTLRLNNYGPRRGDSWYLANDSLLRLGAPLGGREHRFTIPEVVIRARVKVPLLPDPKYTARYYISDMNLIRVSVAAEGAALRIRMEFDSRGTELKGRCSAGCVVGSDDTAPDFQINRSRVDVSLTPAVFRDGLAYSSVNAQFSARVDSSGLGEFFERRVKSEIKSRLEPAIVNALNNDDVRMRIYSALRPTLDTARIGVVRSVRLEGRNLVIDHTPPRR